jgi:hypothetical protein
MTIGKVWIGYYNYGTRPVLIPTVDKKKILVSEPLPMWVTTSIFVSILLI